MKLEPLPGHNDVQYKLIPGREKMEILWKVFVLQRTDKNGWRYVMMMMVMVMATIMMMTEILSRFLWGSRQGSLSVCLVNFRLFFFADLSRSWELRGAGGDKGTREEKDIEKEEQKNNSVYEDESISHLETV